MVGREGVSGQNSISQGRGVWSRNKGRGQCRRGLKGDQSARLCFFSSYVPLLRGRPRGVSQEWWSGSTTQEGWPRMPGHLLGRVGTVEGQQEGVTA